jgi:hypothetical protein
VYEASQLKTLAELQVKLQAQLDTTAADRATVTANVERRDDAIEAELVAAERAGAPPPPKAGT